MEKTNSVGTSGTEECMDDGRPSPCPDVGSVKCRLPDWRELMEALGGTEDLMIFDGFSSVNITGGAGGSTGRVAEPGDLEKSIMEALRDPNIFTIGVCGEEGGTGRSLHPLPTLLESIKRKVERDNLFNILVTECMRFVSDLTEVQKQIARALGFSIPEDGKSWRIKVFRRINKKEVVTENAKQLSERIRAQPTILFILRRLQTTFDLARLGIPIGVDHKGCKLILTSRSEEILLKMNVQRFYRFDTLVAALPISEAGEEAELKRIADYKLKMMQ